VCNWLFISFFISWLFAWSDPKSYWVGEALRFWHLIGEPALNPVTFYYPRPDTQNNYLLRNRDNLENFKVDIHKSFFCYNIIILIIVIIKLKFFTTGSFKILGFIGARLCIHVQLLTILCIYNTKPHFNVPYVFV